MSKNTEVVVLRNKKSKKKKNSVIIPSRKEPTEALMLPASGRVALNRRLKNRTVTGIVPDYIHNQSQQIMAQRNRFSLSSQVNSRRLQSMKPLDQYFRSIIDPFSAAPPHLGFCSSVPRTPAIATFRSLANTGSIGTVTAFAVIMEPKAWGTGAWGRVFYLVDSSESLSAAAAAGRSVVFGSPQFGNLLNAYDTARTISAGLKVQMLQADNTIPGAISVVALYGANTATLYPSYSIDSLNQLRDARIAPGYCAGLTFRPEDNGDYEFNSDFSVANLPSGTAVPTQLLMIFGSGFPSTTVISKTWQLSIQCIAHVEGLTGDDLNVITDMDDDVNILSVADTGMTPDRLLAEVERAAPLPYFFDFINSAYDATLAVNNSMSGGMGGVSGAFARRRLSRVKLSSQSSSQSLVPSSPSPPGENSWNLVSKVQN